MMPYLERKSKTPVKKVNMKISKLNLTKCRNAQSIKMYALGGKVIQEEMNYWIVTCILKI